MLRHAGISEIYTRGHPLLSLAPFDQEKPVFRYITCAMLLLVSSPSSFIVSLSLPPCLYLSRSLASLGITRPAVSATELYSDLYF